MEKSNQTSIWTEFAKEKTPATINLLQNLIPCTFGVFSALHDGEPGPWALGSFEHCLEVAQKLANDGCNQCLCDGYDKETAYTANIFHIATAVISFSPDMHSKSIAQQIIKKYNLPTCPDWEDILQVFPKDPDSIDILDFQYLIDSDIIYATITPNLESYEEDQELY